MAILVTVRYQQPVQTLKSVDKVIDPPGHRFYDRYGPNGYTAPGVQPPATVTIP
jgi:hypothetical protein